MKLKILSFSGESFVSDKVISITLKTKLGELTILDNHSPLIASIIPSTLYIYYFDENNMKQREDFAIGSGVIELRESNVKILADMLVDVEEVDKEKAEEARNKALSLIEKYKNGKNKMDMEKFIEAEDALLKSIAKLKLADLKK